MKVKSSARLKETRRIDKKPAPKVFQIVKLWSVDDEEIPSPSCSAPISVQAGKLKAVRIDKKRVEEIRQMRYRFGQIRVELLKEIGGGVADIGQNDRDEMKRLSEQLKLAQINEPEHFDQAIV